jgi:hypothetical protein
VEQAQPSSSRIREAERDYHAGLRLVTDPMSDAELRRRGL